MSEAQIKFYDPFKIANFNNDCCFLCGCPLDDENRSDEHVFPKWLQQEFKLWDLRIELVNKTFIPYRLLTIPCCKACNNIHLSKLEVDIKAAFEGGYEKFKQLDELRLYQWLCKIYYGILFKELSLVHDRKNPEQGTIMTQDFMERHRNIHAFLQSVRVPIKFPAEKPWSIFIVETQSYPEVELNYDYHDNVACLTFSIRLGGIGILACLEDSSAQKQLFDEYFAQFEGIKLHPIQFDELAAKIAYKASLFNRNPEYFNLIPSTEGMDVFIIIPHVQGLTTDPMFKDWDQKIYAKMLATYWGRHGFDISTIYQEPNLVFTMITNPDGTIKVLNEDGSLNYNHTPLKIFGDDLE
ncbi:MAG: hypothetical protein P4N59_16510 [Negativicutes bacterium]|nr:hypothetical protein [Negativicutes bacterium]